MKVRVCLALALATAVPLVAPVVSAVGVPERPGVVIARSWSDLEGPVLATSDRGSQVLAARRPVPGSDLHGAVMAASLGADGKVWSPLRRLSSQDRTVGLDVDIAGAGHGLVAWTSAGNVYVRSRTDRGGWGPEVRLSRRTGTRWVSVDV